MSVQPYLFFDGLCEAAVQFYQMALGADLQVLMRYRDSPSPPPPGAHDDFGEKIIHASLRIGDTQLLMSDDCMNHPRFEGFSLSLAVADRTDAERKFAALADGGKVTMPLSATFFSPCFGMVTDRFGVAWMLMQPDSAN